MPEESSDQLVYLLRIDQVVVGCDPHEGRQDERDAVANREHGDELDHRPERREKEHDDIRDDQVEGDGRNRCGPSCNRLAVRTENRAVGDGGQFITSLLPLLPAAMGGRCQGG